MAISITSKLQQTGLSTSSSPMSTSSITWTAGNLYIVVLRVYSAPGSNPVTGISSVAGITWTNQFNASVPGGGANEYILVYTGVATSTTTAALSFTTNTLVASAAVYIHEATGISTSGTIVQAVQGSTSTSGTASVTLSAFGSASNATWLVAASSNNQSGTSLVVKSGYTAIDTARNVGSYAYISEYLASSDTSPNVTFSTGASPTVRAWAMEIKAATSGAVNNSCVMMIG